MTTSLSRHARMAAAILAGIMLLSGCSIIDDVATSQPSTRPTATEEAEPSETALAEEAGDYYSITGTAQRDYEPSVPGTIEYCDVDELERAVCAYGELTSSLRYEAQVRGREEIFVDPSGWPEFNDEVEIPGLPHVEDSSDYHGWMFNRSHLVADSLGGNPDVENLVTGTRTQNVGSHQEQGQYAGGMAYTELIARDYLDGSSGVDGDICPLYYAATPVYNDNELIPRSVIVDIQSCDKTIDERVEVFNTASGWDIDYTTGEYAKQE